MQTFEYLTVYCSLFSLIKISCFHLEREIPKRQLKFGH